MSDNWIRLIPENPSYVPTNESIERASHLLWELTPDADEVTADVADEVRFVDAGTNSGRIHCPICGTDIESDWWEAALDRAAEEGFLDLEVTIPGCGHSTSLNELDYEWPVGFSRFALEAMNPNVSHLRDDQLRRLSAALKTPLRVIWQHI